MSSAERPPADASEDTRFLSLPAELQQMIYSTLPLPRLNLFAQDKRFAKGACMNLRNRFTTFLLTAGLAVKPTLVLLERTGSAFCGTRVLSILDPATRSFGTPTIVTPRDNAKVCVQHLRRQGFQLEYIEQIELLPSDTHPAPHDPSFDDDSVNYAQGILDVPFHDIDDVRMSCRGDDHAWLRPHQIDALLLESPPDAPSRPRMFKSPSPSPSQSDTDDSTDEEDCFQGGIAYPYQPMFGGVRRVWYLQKTPDLNVVLIESLSRAIYLPILLSCTSILMNCVSAHSVVSIYPAHTFDGTGLLNTGGVDVDNLQSASLTLSRLREEGYQVVEWCDNATPHYNHDYNQPYCYAGRRSIRDRHILSMGFFGGRGPRLTPYTAWSLGGRVMMNGDQCGCPPHPYVLVVGASNGSGREEYTSCF